MFSLIRRFPLLFEQRNRKYTALLSIEFLCWLATIRQLLCEEEERFVTILEEPTNLIVLLIMGVFHRDGKEF